MNKYIAEDINIIKQDPIINEIKENSSVFITGITGLIGSNLARTLLYLEKNITIYALVRDINKARRLFPTEKICFIEGNIVDEIQACSVDYIFHCASITTSKIMVESPVETIMTSVIGTKNVLDLAVKSGCKSLVFVSSMEMYGSFSESKEIKENDLGYIDPLQVRSNYPESKRMCENMCIAYQKQYGINTKIARLAQSFGPGILPNENRIFAQFARSVINKENIILHTQGLSEGNYCYIRDCILGLIYILLRGKSGEAYNVVNINSHTTIRNMAEMVCHNIANDEIQLIIDIPETNVFGYAKDTKMKLNASKLMELGWRPTVDLEESYIRLIESLREDNNE